MLENTAKQCIPSLELGDLSERKMQAVSRIPAVFLTTKNSHKVEPAGVDPPLSTPMVSRLSEFDSQCGPGCGPD
jgi:hypothetical protein